MRVVTVLFVYVTAITAAPHAVNVVGRIAGGTNTTIREWPQVANVLYTWNWSTDEQHCGGIIINNGTILTAAHCLFSQPANRFRVRVGSAFVNSGGVMRNVARYILHPFYNPTIDDFDVGLIRLEITVVISNQVQPANLARFDYNLRDNEVVHAIGWGAETPTGPRSEELRHVQIWSVNQLECARRYGTENVVITDNMLCAGWLDGGGRDQCQGDNGGPLFHNGVVVGVYSFGYSCGVRFFPSVNVRVSRVSDWIISNSD